MKNEEYADAGLSLGEASKQKSSSDQYHVACAGSLLGIALAKPSSFPVGKVNFMQIDPMTFSEFLIANGDKNLVELNIPLFMADQTDRLIGLALEQRKNICPK